jgi:ribosomal protein L25 (general stress protein Ctc)
MSTNTNSVLSNSTTSTTTTTLNDHNPPKYPQIIAELRTKQGSYQSRKLREMRRVPGIVYGRDQNHNQVKISITVDMLAIIREVRKHALSFENTLYELKIQNESYLCTPRQLQVHPGTVRYEYIYSS